MSIDAKLGEFEKIIKCKFKNRDLLKQALVHRSYINEHKSFALDHNERLEFLGDAVLELVVTDHLYLNYELPEGELTNLRAAVVRGEMLWRVAEELNLSDYLLLSRGEQRGGDKARQYILANAFEAVVGAIYLDRGYKTVEKFINKYIVSKFPEVIENGLHIDSKSKFQEVAQEKLRVTPSYRVLAEEGLDHAKEFVVGVFLDKRKMGEGSGSSKQEAQQKAAEEALKKIED